MRPRPFLLLLVGVALALMALALPTASADITVYINEELMGEHNKNTVTVESGRAIKIWIDLTGSEKENTSQLIILGKFLDEGRDEINAFAQYDAPGDNDIPPDYDRYYVKWPGTGTNGYARDGAYIGVLQVTVRAQTDNGSLLGEQIMFVNIMGDSGSPGFVIEDNLIVIGGGLLALIIFGVWVTKLMKENEEKLIVKQVLMEEQKKDMEARMILRETQRKIAEEEELKKERVQKRRELRQKANVRERALDYDSAIRIWEELGQINEAARVRKLKAEQSAIKVDQTVIHGDYIDDRDTTYIDDRDTIVKDSVINRSNVGSGSSKMQELEKLTEMKDKGIIDDDEFQQMKKEILGK